MIWKTHEEDLRGDIELYNNFQGDSDVDNLTCTSSTAKLIAILTG